MLKINTLSISVISLCLMIVFSYIEELIPFGIGVYRLKIGFSNILTLICLKMLGVRKTLLINVLRLLIVGVLFANTVRFFISVSGFIISYFIIVILFKCLKFSVLVTSINGAVFHNLGQLLAVSLIIKTLPMAVIPIFIVFGIFSGFLVGKLTETIYEKIEPIVFE